MYYSNMFNDGLFTDLFNEMLNLPVDYGKRLRNELVDTRRCTTDIKEFDDRYELDMEFPGFDKEEIKAELKNGYLVVSAEHKENKEAEKSEERAEEAEKSEERAEEAESAADSVEDAKPVKYLCRERFYGKTERSFYVGKELTKADIKAKYVNGVLTLQIPKKVAKPEPEDEVISIL